MTASEPPRRFFSKRDTWLVVLIWLQIVVLAGTSILIWAARMSVGYRLFVSLNAVAIGAFIAWIMYGTHYTFDDDVLRIRSGPFRWVVPIAEISRVTPTRNPLSAPACSLDRLEIRYGAKQIVISPDDKAAFLAALDERTVRVAG